MTRPTDKELIERATKLILEERRAGVQKWFYLSYAKSAEEGGFQGAIYTRAYGFVEATTRTARNGKSPGGQVMGIECPVEHLPAPQYRERLLTADELRKINGGAMYTLDELEKLEEPETDA